MSDLIKNEDLARTIIEQQEEINALKAEVALLKHQHGNAVAEIQRLTKR